MAASAVEINHHDKWPPRSSGYCQRGPQFLVGRPEPSLTRVITLEGSPYGMALTHDGGLLIVASDDRVAFILLTNFGSKTLAVIDVARLPLVPRKR